MKEVSTLKALSATLIVNRNIGLSMRISKTNSVISIERYFNLYQNIAKWGKNIKKYNNI